MLARAVFHLAIATLLATTSRLAAQPADVEALLATPPSPGVEALLLAHATDGRVGRRWIGLLTHATPDIRLSAVRALGVCNVKGASDALLSMLAAEQNTAILAEVLQALAVVAPDADVPQVYASLNRVDAAPARRLLDGLSSARPALVARHLLDAEPLRADAEYVQAAYSRIVRTLPAEAERVEAGVAARPEPGPVEGLLAGAADTGRRLPAPIVAEGLRLSSIRLRAVAYLATVYGTPDAVVRDSGLPTAAITALAAEAEAPGIPVETRWIIELARRWTGGTASAMASAIEELPVAPWLRATPAAVLSVLSQDERMAYAERFGPRTLLDPAPGAASPVRTLTDLPAVMLAGVVAATRCVPTEADERFASIRYRPDRRAAALAVDSEGWSPGCHRAARAAVAMAYGTPPRSPGERTSALVRLDPDFTTCLLARAAPSMPPAIDAQTTTGTPKKVHDQPPAYAKEAIASRLQGIVTVEARIEAAGCIAEVDVIRSVHAWLDTAAVRAISRWRYAPTLLNGVPVPVIMSSDVHFSLR